LSGREFTITLKDIPTPTHCKYLGIRLEYRASGERGSRPNNLASIDRIDSDLGYIPSNIQVISFLANRMKTDASVVELVAFARGVLQLHG